MRRTEGFGSRSQSVMITVPCYNEAARLDRAEYLRLVQSDGVRLLFVNDGSTDETASLIEQLVASAPDRVAVLSLERNAGKAEAVRRGLLRSLEMGAPIVGYVDADLATPVDEILRLVRKVTVSSAAVVMGSRVKLLGRRIVRSAVRHYLGRV